MQTRVAKPEDAAAISRLLQVVFANTYGSALDDATLSSHLETHLSEEPISHELKNAHFFVAEDSAHLLGVLKLSYEGDKIEIAKLYVSAHAVKQGVGSSLLEAALALSMAKQAKSIWLNVWKKNTGAIEFYKKHGFSCVGDTHVYVCDTVFDDFVMEKQLVTETQF